MSNCEYPDLRSYYGEQKYKRRLKKSIKQRMRFGVADCDTWNFDIYLVKIIIRGLRQLADHLTGYPGYEPFDTEEKWRSYLLSLSDKFEMAYKYTYEDISKEKEGVRLLKEAFSELAEHLTAMWD